jgi:hypothetical protein
MVLGTELDQAATPIIDAAETAVASALNLPTFTNPVLVGTYQFNDGPVSKEFETALNLTEEYGIEAVCSLMGLSKDTLSLTLTVVKEQVYHVLFKVTIPSVKMTQTLRVMEKADADLIQEGTI